MLSRMKLEGESFSDMIRRLASRSSLADYAGFWSGLPEEEWEAFEEGIRELRRRGGEARRVRALKVVETTFLIYLLREDPETVEKARELDEEGGAATTAVNAFELGYGVYRGMRDVGMRLEEAMRVLSSLEIFPLDLGVSLEAAEIAENLDREGEGVDPFDALIVGVVRGKGVECIVTRNVAHLEGIPALRVEEH